MSRLPLTIIVAVVLSACASPTPAPTTTLTPTEAATPVLGPPISASGSAKAGVSKSFKLDPGSYTVAWTVTAPKGGCYFSLFLALRTTNSLAVESVSGLLNSGGAQDGTDDWTDVPGGTFVLREDRSGVANCKGAWSATLTPH